MNPDSRTWQKLLAAAIAAAAAYMLVGATFLLLVGWFWGWQFLGAFAAVPAAMFALIPLRGRIFFLGLGLLLFGVGFAMDLRGAHNPLIAIPFFGLCLTGAALMAELCVRAFQLFSRCQGR